MVLRDALHPDAQPFARLARAKVEWSLDGFWSPRVALQRVVLSSPEVYVRRDGAGHTNVDGVIERLLAPRVDDDDEKTTTTQRLPNDTRHVINSLKNRLRRARSPRRKVTLRAR